MKSEKKVMVSGSKEISACEVILDGETFNHISESKHLEFGKEKSDADGEECCRKASIGITVEIVIKFPLNATRLQLEYARVPYRE